MNDDDLRGWFDDEGRLGQAPSTDGGVAPGWSDVVARGRRQRARRGRRRVAVVVSVVALALIAAVALVARPDEGGDLKTVGPPPGSAPTAGLFATPTGVTLIVDDGGDGLVALDLDRGLAQRYVEPGKIQSTRNHRVIRARDHLVFPTAAAPASVPLDLVGPAQPIGTGPAQAFTPAGAADQVWVAYPTATGEAVALAPAGGGPIDDATAVTWGSHESDSLTGTATHVMSIAQTFGWMAAGQGELERLQFGSLCSPFASAGDSIVVGGGDITPDSFCHGVQRISPNGTVSMTIPLPVAHPEEGLDQIIGARSGDQAVVLTAYLALGSPETTEVWLADFTTGTARQLDVPVSPAVSLALSDDGRQLLWIDRRGGQTFVGRDDLATDTVEEHPLDLGLDPAVGDPVLAVAEGVIALPSDRGPRMAATDQPCGATVTSSVCRLDATTTASGLPVAPPLIGQPPRPGSDTTAAPGTTVVPGATAEPDDTFDPTAAAEPIHLRFVQVGGPQPGAETPLAGARYQVLTDDRKVVTQGQLDDQGWATVYLPAGRWRFAFDAANGCHADGKVELPAVQPGGSPFVFTCHVD